jgi:hypothetical protein
MSLEEEVRENTKVLLRVEQMLGVVAVLVSQPQEAAAAEREHACAIARTAAAALFAEYCGGAPACSPAAAPSEPAPAEEKPAAPDAAKAEQAPAPAQAVTLDDVKKAAVSAASANGRDFLVEVLSDFGVEKVSELQPDQYAEAIARFGMRAA